MVALPAGQSQTPVSALQLPTLLQAAVQPFSPGKLGEAAVVQLTDRACLHHFPKVCLQRLEMSSWGCACRPSWL